MKAYRQKPLRIKAHKKEKVKGLGPSYGFKIPKVTIRTKVVK